MFTLKNIKSDDKVSMNNIEAFSQLIQGNDMLSELPLHLQRSILFLAQSANKKEQGKVKLDNPFKLASLFMAKDDVRYYLNYIHSTGESLIASNGHVLIRITQFFEQGFYNKSGVLVENKDFAKFPDFQKVYEKPKSELFELDISDQSIHYHNKKQVIYVKINDTYYMKQYIDILKKIGIDKVSQSEEKDMKILYFSKDNFSGVIMPIKA